MKVVLVSMGKAGAKLGGMVIGNLVVYFAAEQNAGLALSRIDVPAGGDDNAIAIGQPVEGQGVGLREVLDPVLCQGVTLRGQKVVLFRGAPDAPGAPWSGRTAVYMGIGAEGSPAPQGGVTALPGGNMDTNAVVAALTPVIRESVRAEVGAMKGDLQGALARIVVDALVSSGDDILLTNVDQGINALLASKLPANHPLPGTLVEKLVLLVLLNQGNWQGIFGVMEEARKNRYGG